MQNLSLFDCDSEFEEIDSIYRVDSGGRSNNFYMARSQITKVFDRKVYRDIINSPAFQRLKNIRFLGAIDYAYYPDDPKKMHTRYQHSLGVARLALVYARALDLEEIHEKHCVVAALLHDIGHAPFSHSLESVFISKFSISHHIIGEYLIKGGRYLKSSDIDSFGSRKNDLARLGENLYQILADHNIDNIEIIALISGYGSIKETNNLFSLPINVDTIEGIMRANSYLSEGKKLLSPEILIGAFLKLAINSKKHSQRFQEIEFVPLLDAFWRTKKLIYSTFINSEFGLLADLVCKKYMEENLSEFNEGSFLKTEKEVYADHADLFNRLALLRKGKGFLEQLDLNDVQIQSREFLIQEYELQSMGDIAKRYRQVKV